MRVTTQRRVCPVARRGVSRQLRERGEAAMIVRGVTGGTERMMVFQDQYPWVRCGIGVAHPAGQPRNAGFAIYARQGMPIEPQRLARRGAIEFSHKQMLVARAGLPCDMPDWIAGAVLAKGREFIAPGDA